MATNYADTADVTELILQADEDASEATDNEVLYAETLLDLYAFQFRDNWNETTNRVLTVGDGSLTPQQEYALTVAVARQVEYVRRMGKSFFQGSQYGQVSGDGFSQTGKLARISDDTDAVLQSAGLTKKTGRIGSGNERPVNWFETGWDIRQGDL